MRNYETIYLLLYRLKAIAADDAAFAQSERDRLQSERIVQQVREVFADESAEQIRQNIAPILAKTYLVQFFDYRQHRFFLDLPHLRIFTYLFGCFGRFAPNENLADFAVSMAKLARDNIQYSNNSLAELMNDLANQ